MPKIDYLKIFRDAWKITWNNRFLWWFGFFLLMSGGLNFNYLSSNDERFNKDWKDIAEKIQLQEFISKYFTIIIIGLTILVLLFLVFLILSFISRGALVKSTQRILKNKPADLKTGLIDGKKYFWKILSIFFFSGIIMAVCVSILALPIIILLIAKSYIIATIFAIFAFIILIFLIILCKYIQTYTCFYVILADLKPWLAAENAYALFKKNILASIIMSLFFIPLGIFSFVVLTALILTVLLIFGIIGLVLFFSFKETGAILATTSGLFVFIFATIIFFSIFKTFSEVAWVLFFHIIAAPTKKEGIIEETATEEDAPTLPGTEAMKTIETETKQ